jgi:5-hydroxyisourate hydrolase
MSITVRVLDLANGRPAADLLVRLSRDRDGCWQEDACDRTDANGYLVACPPGTMTRGVHRIDVEIDEYFAGIGVTPFYPRVTIIFRVTDLTVSYHIPLLITPYAYATCRETQPGQDERQRLRPLTYVSAAEGKEGVPDEVPPARPYGDPAR